MAAHRPRIRKSEHAAAAIIALDPAAVGPCGIAARTTVGLKAPKLEKLAFPSFAYSGWVFNPRMHDDLALWVADVVGKDQRVLLVVENAAFHGAARHLGRAIGCIEGLLYDLNVAHPGDTQYVSPAAWRWVLGPDRPTGRENLKQYAIDHVAQRYGQTVTNDLAEAVCMLDWFTLAKPKVWSLGQKTEYLAAVDISA